MFLELCRQTIVISALVVFIYIAWIDWRTMEIPDRCHLILLGLAGLQIMCGVVIPLETRGLGLIAMSLPMVITNVIREDSFGGGDIKMCGATGFLLGAPQMVAGSLLALLLAGIYSGVALLLKIKKPKDSFALGPFLSIGFIISMLGTLPC
jgi:leader peptidase (prepilin peptidase) / N-methyltransferase